MLATFAGSRINHGFQMNEVHRGYGSFDQRLDRLLGLLGHGGPVSLCSLLVSHRFHASCVPVSPNDLRHRNWRPWGPGIMSAGPD